MRKLLVEFVLEIVLTLCHLNNCGFETYAWTTTHRHVCNINDTKWEETRTEKRMKIEKLEQGRDKRERKKKWYEKKTEGRRENTHTPKGNFAFIMHSPKPSPECRIYIYFLIFTGWKVVAAVQLRYDVTRVRELRGNSSHWLNELWCWRHGQALEYIVFFLIPIFP